jgi:hypothetical protein
MCICMYLYYIYNRSVYEHAYMYMYIYIHPIYIYIYIHFYIYIRINVYKYIYIYVYTYIGCETANQVGPFTKHENYLKTCVDLIMEFNCPDTTICALNCASNEYIDHSLTHMLPINNYGSFHLRIRLCMATVHPQKLNRYSMVNTVFCKEASQFTTCSRFIPPHSFIPIAIPINATSIEVDSCDYNRYVILPLLCYIYMYYNYVYDLIISCLFPFKCMEDIHIIHSYIYFVLPLLCHIYMYYY